MPLALLLGIAIVGGQGVQADPYRPDETDFISPAEHRSRREALLAAMPAGSAAVIFTNPERQRSNDTDFPFRPESNFWYLTGFREPEAALICAPGGFELDGKRVREALFLRDRNPAQETWTGKRIGPERAPAVTGIDLCLSNRRFADGLKAITGLTRMRVDPVTGAVGDLAKMIGSAGEPDKSAPSLVPILNRLRVVKSPAELVLMRKAIDTSLEGHRKAIAMARPNSREWELRAVMEYTFAKSGCESVAYNSIVGSGENSCTLHYEEDRKELHAGEMVVMDCGAEFHGYAADVTRSFPVSGKFSPEQASIYNLVLAAQNAGIAACREGAPFNAADTIARKTITDGLMKLGIISNPVDVRRYFMHGTSHYVGLDVHDSPGSNTLLANSVLTVEPGIYVAANSPCDPKWWNIGVRIEDDILVTPGDPVNLSGALPRTISAIEKLMH